MSNLEACRACSVADAGPSNYVSILDKTDEGFIIMDLLIYTTSLDISVKDDDLPKKICINCLEELEIAANFKKKCLNTDLVMRAEIEAATAIQYSIEIDEMDDKNPGEIQMLVTKNQKSASPPLKKKSKDYSKIKKELEAQKEMLSEIEKSPQEIEMLLDFEKTIENTETTNQSATSVKEEFMEITNEEEDNELIEIEYLEDDEVEEDQEGGERIVSDDVPYNKYVCIDELKGQGSELLVLEHRCCGCSQRFKSLDELKAHGLEAHSKVNADKVCHDGMVRQCNICYKIFEGTSYRSSGHFKSIFASRLQIINAPCCGCEKSFKSYEELKEHSFEHLDNKIEDEAKPWECEICFRRFARKNYIYDHRRYLNKTRIAKTKTRNKNQVKYELEDTSEVRCCGCKDVFNTVDELTQHSIAVHESFRNINGIETRPFECDICFKSYVTAITLEQHQYAPYMLKKFVCLSCGDRFATNVLLNKHEKSEHSQDQMFECELCPGKKFLKVSSFQSHTTRHKQTFECPTCGKVSKTKQRHEEHLTVHSSETPFACTLCSKRFKRRDLVRTHMRVHNGNKPYSCKYCERSFAHWSDCKRHEMIHTGEYPFACELCGKKFTRKPQYEQHLNTHA